MEHDPTLLHTFETALTEEVVAIDTATFEGPSAFEVAFEVRLLPSPLDQERAYLVEVHVPRRAPGLLAIRTSLREAHGVANAVHPGVADVVIRELSLPCDASSLTRAKIEPRTWSRDAAGTWSPPLILLDPADPVES